MSESKSGISVYPKSGPVQGGTKITILGKNLAIEESQIEYSQHKNATSKMNLSVQKKHYPDAGPGREQGICPESQRT